MYIKFRDGSNRPIKCYSPYCTGVIIVGSPAFPAAVVHNAELQDHCDT
jgi:hypothetical protein